MSKELSNIADEALPTTKIKAAFFDIDGTLLGLNGHYTSASKQEILRVRSLGVKTAVASGRPYFAAKFIVELTRYCCDSGLKTLPSCS